MIGLLVLVPMFVLEGESDAFLPPLALSYPPRSWRRWWSR